MDLEESRPSDATTTYSEFMLETAEGPQVRELDAAKCQVGLWSRVGYLWRGMRHTAVVSPDSCATVAAPTRITRSKAHSSWPRVC